MSPLNGDGSEPVLVTAGTRRTKRLEGSYDWQNVELSRHESQSSENANVCSAQVLAGSHFRRKRPQRRYAAKCTSRAKDHFLPRDDCNGDLGVLAAWWPSRSGPHVHGVFQFTLIFPKWFFSVSPCPRRCAAVHQVLVRHFGAMHRRTFGKMVGQCTTVHHEVVIVQCSS